MTTAIYPGSFDPLTFGHVDIVERSARLFDNVIVSILTNSEKVPLFSVEERTEIMSHTDVIRMFKRIGAKGRPVAIRA